MATSDEERPVTENERPEYESKIPEAVTSLYEAVEILKQIDHNKITREHERYLSGGRWCGMEKMLISARNASDEALKLIRIVDGYPEKRPFIRYIKEDRSRRR
ncbi:hypothetical protein T281_14685 [Rhodomicrobium udaipurense JA643]|uniref:Uncharacterized protein n=1 Tax=Rhodomicrobium udaipurense TaxID=1202716 RepID=A0A8I1GIJ7_9HYPH|nr:hypothetical protein [Rhodomicrobium udaipurense]KAI93777.1 hypothetical protein T281_14685 [Rhodomicrobium udaipurense JA643]MBJ7544415.1 hypothetical protein [Rhodomicrobium udaipurense]